MYVYSFFKFPDILFLAVFPSSFFRKNLRPKEVSLGVGNDKHALRDSMGAKLVC